MSFNSWYWEQHNSYIYKTFSFDKLNTLYFPFHWQVVPRCIWRSPISSFIHTCYPRISFCKQILLRLEFYLRQVIQNGEWYFVWLWLSFYLSSMLLVHHFKAFSIFVCMEIRTASLTDITELFCNLWTSYFLWGGMFMLTLISDWLQENLELQSIFVLSTVT